MAEPYGPAGDGDQPRRWLRLLLIVLALVALLVLVVNLAGGLGGHQGPCRHQPGGCDGDQSAVTEPGRSHTGPPSGFEHPGGG